MRTNGTFEYKPVGSVQTDPKTGFVIPNDKAPFLQGCECQIDKSIPAKQVVGTDGQIYAYTYDVFIPKYFMVCWLLVVRCALQAKMEI